MSTTTEYISYLNPETLEILLNSKLIPWGMVAIAIVVSILILKEPISERITKIKSVKYNRDKDGNKRIEVDAEEEIKEEVKESKEEQVEPEESEPEESEPEESEEVPTTLEGWKREMFFRALTKEDEKMQKAFESALLLAEDEDEEKTLEISFAEYKVRFLKDDSFIAKIDAFTDVDKYNDVTAAKAFASLAGIRFLLKDFVKSKMHYEAAASLTVDVDRKCIFERLIARSRYELGEKQDALLDLEKLIEKYTNPKHQIAIYKELAELYEEMGNNELRALAVEKALELGDDDHNTYFSAAYAYSHSDFDKLSLLHYQSALRLGSGEGSLNNMGVQYDQLGLPLKSIEYYSKSFADNNTLAAANMAYRLIGAGFLDDAKKILGEAQSKKSDKVEVHDNVYSALASIKSEEEKEDKREKQILKEAAEQQRFFRNYAKCYFTKSTTPTIDVNYFSTKDAEINVEVVKGKIKGFWKEKVKRFEGDGYFTYEHKFEGELHNCAAKITLYKESLYGSSDSGDIKYEKETEGYLYINGDNEVKLLIQNRFNKQNYELAELGKWGQPPLRME